MALDIEILGRPGRDNAAFVRIDTGHSIHRLLFDCGQGCIDGLPVAEVRQTEHLFFSHFHFDHVAGFDSLFRLTYDRPNPPMTVWGPPGTTEVLEHRLRGFLWNLHYDRPGEWIVHEIGQDIVSCSSYMVSEAFRLRHAHPDRPFGGAVYSGSEFDVTAIFLDHGTHSLGYIVREAPRSHILIEPIVELGLRPGPWLQQLKDLNASGAVSPPSGPPIALEDLRSRCVRVTPGESLAYLTDFSLTPQTMQQLADRLTDVDTVVCESQYRDSHRDLAVQNHHMTARRSAELAGLAGAGRLMLIHTSDRYAPSERLELLEEARAVFPNTNFPPGWDSEAG